MEKTVDRAGKIVYNDGSVYAEGTEMKETKQTSRRRLRAAILAAGITVALAVLVVVLLVVLLPKDEPAPEPDTRPITFYPVWDGDVRENELYLGLDRQFYLCDPDYGSKEALDDDQLEADPKLALLRDYINSLINGYPNACRSLFTAAALAEDPVPDFAQQMIWRVEITKTEEQIEEGTTRTTYCLEYMIYRNNGTYRRDVGSNAVRPEYLTLIEVAEGEYRIDSLRR